MGRYITSVNYGNGVWAVVMSKIPGYAGQRWFTSSSFPKDKIKESWDAGKYITSLTYGNGVWAVVMTEFPYLQAKVILLAMIFLKKKFNKDGMTENILLH